MMSGRCCARCADIIEGKCLGWCHVIRGHARVPSADARPGVLHMVAALFFLLHQRAVTSKISDFCQTHVGHLCLTFCPNRRAECCTRENTLASPLICFRLPFEWVCNVCVCSVCVCAACVCVPACVCPRVCVQCVCVLYILFTRF